MNYSIYYSASSEKYILRLPKSKTDSLLKRIQYVASDPFKKDNNIAKLAGTISSYRLRIGDIRVIYWLDQESKRLYVTKIAPRGSIYAR